MDKSMTAGRVWTDVAKAAKPFVDAWRRSERDGMAALKRLSVAHWQRLTKAHSATAADGDGAAEVTTVPPSKFIEIALYYGDQRQGSFVQRLSEFDMDAFFGEMEPDGDLNGFSAFTAWEDKYSEKHARTFSAMDAEHAAELFASGSDEDGADYAIASGAAVTIAVRDDDGVLTKWQVSGEMVPTYDAVQLP